MGILEVHLGIQFVTRFAMQSHFAEEPIEAPNVLLHASSAYSNADYLIEETSRTVSEPTRFFNHFVGYMDMHATVPTVMAYLDAHQEWFCRCAHPMKVEPLGNNGYALVIGKFGSFGYEVEPKIGLHLLPQDEGIYRIETIPVPGYTAPGYDVDFRAAMELVEANSEQGRNHSSDSDASSPLTRVQWDLNLTVTIQFPRFIHSLPKHLVQNTGDRLLHQIVRQVSRRLTRKVQEDFHQSLNLPLPWHAKKHFFWQTSQSESETH